MQVQRSAVLSRPACARPSTRVARPAVVVRAEPEGARGLNFTASTQAAEGYIEKDTAGQSNMYPTIIRPVEVSASNIDIEQENKNFLIAVGTAGVVLGFIGVGLFELTGSNTSAAIPEDLLSYKSLSEYSSVFEAQIKPAPVVISAPVPAPALAAEPAPEAAPEL